MFALKPHTHYVALQFFLKEPFSGGVRVLPPETEKDRRQRESVSGGRQIGQAAMGCLLEDCIDGLSHSDYHLRDAFLQERFQPKNVNLRYSAQFVFWRKGNAPEKEPALDVGQMHHALIELCRPNLWRVRMFANPHYDSSRARAGNTVQIVMDTRRRLVNPDGSPAMADPRDNHGDPAALLHPLCRLCVEEGEIKLISVC